MNNTERFTVAFISVGSNIDPERNILAALKALMDRTHVTETSTFYRTVPLGRTDQPMYINGAWSILTGLSPRQIKTELLQPVESLLGRQRTSDKFASRTIDLDLILYNDLVCQDPDVRIPHPDLNRPFVCGPIMELLESGRGKIERDLKDRMLCLLPSEAVGIRPGEMLVELTQQLRQMLGH